ncbi:extragenic suppressor protein SuhB [Orientia tsutsugamushi]|uniref:extragenic suppressor protein SuhB n=1 Tax=Orientia tsutsugamushi TaxID=784 RepID=UPI0005F8D104|nr:extragenic suppressor protein SuhB [Orientia tsutsugamushi]KJV75705.1 putative extragenic suppressor protein SuhB [Orientia tsutsugamushi str. TA763]SPP23878.1 extragenic suppressor protein SuhB [Orientia tsutsugamushi]
MTLPIINILEQIIRKATVFLLRDFSELDVIQNTKCDTRSFVIHSCIQIQKRIIEGVSKYSQNDIGKLIFYHEQQIQNLPDGKYLLVNLIDNLINLEKALPFFCIEFSLHEIVHQKRNIQCGIQYFPAIGEIYYMDNNEVWVDKFNHQQSNRFKIRVPSSKINKSKLLAMEFMLADSWHKAIPMKINNTIIKSEQIRCFGSLRYACTLFLTGKLDVIIYDHLAKNYDSDDLIKLIVTRAGGIINNISSNINVICAPSIRISV